MQQEPIQIDSWKIIRKIGDGSFGQIYQVTSNESPDTFAIKTESITNIKQMLLLEYQIYKQFAGESGFPHIFHYAEKQTFTYMVMQKFEFTLDKYAANLFPNTFLPKDCLLSIMSQTLNILRKIHAKGYLYRDVKPSNFMLKIPYNKIFIIDFGLSKSYQVNGRHISQKIGKKLVGTPLFCSLNTHAGIQQSRRDDIQTWIYSMLYLAMNLPWESILSKNNLSKQEQYVQIGKIKSQVEWEAVIKGNSEVPNCFVYILEHIKQLKFDERPNYQRIQIQIKQQYKKACGKHMDDDIGIVWQSQIPKKNTIKKKINKIQFKIGKCNLPVEKSDKKYIPNIEKENVDLQREKKTLE